MSPLPPQPLSPLDGRYRAAVEGLGEHLSEAGLNRARVHVEVEWLLFLADRGMFGAQAPTAEHARALRSWAAGFGQQEIDELARIEATTRHDVKAVEYFLKARLAAAPDAPVTEAVDPARLTLAWLARRAFRSGQSHALRFLGSPARRVAAVPPAAAKAAACLALAALGAVDPAAWRRQLVRAALHAGVVSRLLGLREGILYG